MTVLQKTALALISTKIKMLALVNVKRASKELFEFFCTPPSRVVKPLSLSFRQAEQLQLTFDGKKMIGYRWNADAHRKVLIVHGFESSIVNFEHYITLLRDRGFQVIGFDAPAHGQSEGKTLNAKQYADFILQIFKTYGSFDGFISHSFGGLGLSLALEGNDHPQQKVVFIAPATESTTAAKQLFRALKIKDEKLQQGMFDHIRTIVDKDLDWFSIARIAPSLSANILWLHDKKDRVTPWIDAEKVQQLQLPNIRFVVTEGLGHRRIYHDGEVVKKVIEFITG